MVFHRLPMFGIGVAAVGVAMVVYGLAAEYVYNDPHETVSEEETESRGHLMLVLKGLACIVFAVLGIIFGWF